MAGFPKRLFPFAGRSDWAVLPSWASEGRHDWEQRDHEESTGGRAAAK
jgi:hypothetical protein